MSADLTKLKKLLQGEKPDEKAVKALLHKLGKETDAIAGEDETAAAKKIKELGAALSKA